MSDKSLQANSCLRCLRAFLSFDDALEHRGPDDPCPTDEQLTAAGFKRHKDGKWHRYEAS